MRAQRYLRQVRRFTRKRPVATRLIIACLIIGGLLLLYRQPTPMKIDSAAYQPLLATIAKGESRGNYNAHYGQAGNTSVRFTDMTISQVLQWQQDFVAQGSPSSAVGRYQFVRPTLAGLVEQRGIDGEARFDEAMQDELAVALLERRGVRQYVAKQLSREELAANLAKEWAALPKVIGDRPEESYYAGDGLNEARISIDEVFSAIQAIDYFIEADQ